MYVHRNIITNYSQQGATFLNLIIFTHALHVSGGSSTHNQEHITVHTTSVIVNQIKKGWILLAVIWNLLFSMHGANVKVKMYKLRAHARAHTHTHTAKNAQLIQPNKKCSQHSYYFG
jgi:hypothetical protein